MPKGSSVGERRRRLRRRALPLVFAALVAVGIGVGVGATAGGGDEPLTPSNGSRASSADRPRVLGCEPAATGIVRNGSRYEDRVALTFDDGPGPDTPEVMRILEEGGAGATFFVTGAAASRAPEVLDEMMRSGFELGSHSMAHEQYPTFESIQGVADIVQAATGFEPCLFRPPYGLVDAATEAAATEAGMATVLWDVDSSDYAAPSAAEVLAQAEQAESGSILVMHDGPEQRDATVEALPTLIRDLKSKGFELVTVTELLGGEFVTAPR